MIRASRQRACAALASLLLLACKPGASDGLALVGATLIDGSGGPALPDAAIVIRGGRIEWVGDRSGFELPRKTREVDVSGRWIIPGLIDGHAHLGPSASWARPRYLAWGVTTLRDVHGGIVSLTQLRKRKDAGPPDGPRVYIAGAMIDGLPTTYTDAIGVSGESDARKGVDQLVTGGADLIKVYTRIDAPLLRAIVDEARAFNLGVTGHLGMTDAVTAAKSGIAAIEHMSGVAEAASANPSSLFTAHYRGFFPGWTAAERRWADLDSAALTRVAQRLAEAKVTIIPTLVLHETLSRLNEPGLLRDPALEDVPEEQRLEWDVRGMISRAGWTDDDFAAFRRSRPKQDLFLRAFAAAGGRIVAGTDASNQLLVPGHSEHRELELLVRAGLTPREALRAATRNAAVLLGVDSLGLLAPGKAADLLILSKDPLMDIRNTRAIQAVVARGHLLDADSIRATW
ncbi:MAG TPA: amidohydrolase family protein [Gemmatimonadales bacterium]|nr:amidohydrolase family protein [Gemmatimonadales bacterium]